MSRRTLWLAVMTLQNLTSSPFSITDLLLLSTVQKVIAVVYFIASVACVVI